MSNQEQAITEQMLDQLDDVLNEVEEYRRRAQYEDLSDLSVEVGIHLATRARGVVERIAGKSSVYGQQCERILGEDSSIRPYTGLKLSGVVRSLKADVEKGYLKSQTELIHGELFGDFLEMAQHLLDEKYKDAAAVVAGSSLEAHLRQLCHKDGIDTERQGDGKPKNAERLNTELAKAEVYSKGDQKNVTAWIDLRNDAAHGHYEKYQDGQVGLMISGVRDFIARNPA